MKNALVVGLIVGVLGGLSLRAEARETQTYVELHGGATFANDVDAFGNRYKLDSGYAAGGAVGVDFGPARVEGEITYYRNGSKKSGDVSQVTFMANGYYDIPGLDPVVPYIGGGFGGAYVSFNNLRNGFGDRLDGDGFEPAFQFAAGIAVGLNKHIDADVGYRLLLVPVRIEHDFGGGEDDDTLLNQTVMAALRFKF